MNRRQFLTTSAAATAALAATKSYGQTPVGANAKIRVGLIGCGGMGIGDLDTFFQNSEVDCPVVCDVDDAHLANGVGLVEARRGNTPETARDFRKVLERKDLDAVIVATPDHWHALPTIQACQAELDVYTEKPLAATIEEGRAMVRAMREHQRVVQMGTQWRSGTHYKEAAEFIQSGKLGKVRLVRCWAYLDWVGAIGNPPDGAPPAGVDYDMWLGPAPLRSFNPNRFHFNFRWFWDYAGGLMTDWGVHLLNIAIWAMGPDYPTAVSASGGKHVLTDNTETPDTQIAVYDFPNYTLIWEHALQIDRGPNGKPHGIMFCGSEGQLLIDDEGWRILPERKKESLKLGLDPAVYGIDPKPAEPLFERPAGRDARPAHVRNFLDCMGTRQDPVEHLELGHQVSTVAHLGNIALRSGVKIHWDAQNEQVTNSPEADALVAARYREPWTLPYRTRG